MVLGWIFKRPGHAGETTGLWAGLWAYLASRDQNKSRIELERARIAATKELIERLPNGAVYREGTPDGWREIQMPPVSQTSLLVVPVEPRDSEPHEPSELAEPPHAPMALDLGKESGLSDGSPLIGP